MKKIFKEIFTSKLYLTIFIVSVLIIIVHFIIYNNNVSKYEKWYQIDTATDVAEYDEEIDLLNDAINNLDKKDENYSENKKYIEDEIKIYEELKKNNIDYNSVYDYGIGNSDERIIYLNNTNAIFKFILIINIIVIIYICFTREFDSSIYSLIYTNGRGKMVLKRVGCFFVTVVVSYLVYLGIILFFSSVFESDLSYVLVIDSNEALFESLSTYISKDYVFQNLYIVVFASLILWSISLIANKTLYVIGGFALFAILYIGLEYANLPVTTFLGLKIDYSLFNYGIDNILKLWILLPTGLFFLSFNLFLKKDL